MGQAATATASKTGTQLSVYSIVVAAVLGILAGLVFGDYTRVLRPIGQVYLMLLEVAVYPYLIASLLHGLASMTPATAWKLFRAGWPFYLFLWGVTFGLLWLLSLSFPQPLPFTLETGGSASSSLLQQMLAMIIPSDFFTALSRNYVPAVVLFCVFFGIAFQKVKDKQALLSILDGIRQASFIFWNYIINIMPYAVFALLADSAGTLRLRNFGSIGLYLLLFFAGVLLLVFWLIPGCLNALTPFKYREVMGQLRSGLMVALVTTLPATALPFIVEATRELARRCDIEDPERDEVIRTHITVAYPLAQLGNFFVYLYVIFVAFLLGKPISALEADILPFITLLSCFGTPAGSVNSVSFISNAFHLPSGVGDLYVELMTITRYGQVIASVSGYAFLSFVVVLAYYGKLKVRWTKLAEVLGVTVILALGASAAVRAVYVGYLHHQPSPYLSFSLDSDGTRDIPASFATKDEVAAPLAPDETVMQRIQRTGVLRVGYNPGVIPFCYRNAHGDLVGYDVAYAYQLARDLNVKLRFVPFDWENLDAQMKSGAFDIAMAGIYLTRDRLLNLGTTHPYFQSPLAFFTLRDRARDFLSRDQIEARPHSRLGAFDGSILLPILRNTFPQATIVPGESYATIPDFTQIDGALWSLTQSEALAAAHPELIAVPTRDLGNPVLFVYLVPPNSDDFLKLLNYWLLVEHDSGFEKSQTAYWIERQPRPDHTPRWSLLRQLSGK